MKTFTKLTFLILFISLNACNDKTNSGTKTNPLDSAQTDSVHINDTSTSSENTANENLGPDSISSLHFNGFTLNFHEFHFSIYNNPSENDTIEIEAELGENLDGKMITFNSELYYDFTIEQRYETSVSIMAEGPHCDLTDWEHYVSEWQALSKNHLEEYFLYTYNEKESQMFPNVSSEVLKKAVKKHCGDEWAEHIKTVKTPNEYPSGVGISRYFLKISAKRINNGKSVQKIIVILAPMGC